MCKQWRYPADDDCIIKKVLRSILRLPYSEAIFIRALVLPDWALFQNSSFAVSQLQQHRGTSTSPAALPSDGSPYCPSTLSEECGERDGWCVHTLEPGCLNLTQFDSISTKKFKVYALWKPHTLPDAAPLKPKLASVFESDINMYPFFTSSINSI